MPSQDKIAALDATQDSMLASLKLDFQAISEEIKATMLKFQPKVREVTISAITSHLR